MVFNAIEERNRLKEEQESKESIFQSFIHKFQQKQELKNVFVFKDLSSEGFLHLKHKGHEWWMAIFETKKYDLFYLDDKETNAVIDAYWELHKLFGENFKEIYTSMPEDNKLQQRYYQYKIEQARSREQLNGLEDELEKLTYLEETFKKMATYPCVFGKTKDELLTNISEIQRISGSFLNLTLAPIPTIKSLLFRLHNLYGSPFFIDEIEGDVQKEVQAQGGVSFSNETYYRTGDFYGAVINVIGKPTIYHEFWLYGLTNFANTFTVIDYFEDQEVDYIDKISDSIEEIGARSKSAKKTSEKDVLNDEQMILRNLNLSMTNGETGETVKKFHIRIHVRESTQESLETKISQIQKDLDNKGFQGTVHIAEQKEEWQSILLPYTEQRMLINHREGLEIQSEALGVGFGYNQTSLSDPAGRYYGLTSSGGTVYWDIFHKSSSRLYYNLIALGDMGSGKSTLVKSIFKDNADRGHYIRGFDVAGDYKDLTHHYNGAYIPLDGTKGTINPFQVFPTVTKQEGDSLEIDIPGCFTSFLASLGRRFKMFDKELSNSSVNTFKSEVKNYFVHIGLWGEGSPVQDITALPSQNYPIMEEVYGYIKDRMTEYKKSEPYRAEQLEPILIIMESLMSLGTNLFNQHTTMEDLADRQIVMFDISNLLTYGEDIFDMQFASAMELVKDVLMKHGKKEKEAFDKKQKHWWDIKRSLILIDECQNELNAKKDEVVQEFLKLMSEGRKFFIGTVLATQRVQNLFPDMKNVADKNMASAVDNLRKLFSLCQYKVILKQDDTSEPMLRQLFENTFTDREYERMAKLKVVPNVGAQGILNIAGDQNIHMTFEISEFEKSLFAGGA